MKYRDFFYNSEEWIETSKFIKDLYGRRCMKCGQKNGEMHTDHIVPRSVI